MSEKMTNRLVIFKNGEAEDEVALEAKSMLIGRDARSDIQLNDLSVSRRHARLTCIYNEYCLEDLDSTNGTILNEQPVTKRILKHGDLLRIGSFTLRYHGRDEKASEDELDKTVVIRSSEPAAAKPASRKDPSRVLPPKSAALRFFRGPQKGQQDRIDRTLYTIGQPGGEVAAIARRPQGFFLLHIGGDRYPRINNKEIQTTKGVQLNEGDMVEVGEHLVEISFKT